MARRENGKSAVKRAGKAIARTAKKLTSKLRPGRRHKTAEEPVVAKASVRATTGSSAVLCRLPGRSLEVSFFAVRAIAFPARLTADFPFSRRAIRLGPPA